MNAPRDGIEAWHRYSTERASFADIDARIHVWRVGLDGLGDGIGDNLSDDELARADRFRLPEDRARFVAARGTLRAILADILDLEDPCRGRTLRFGYGAAGKPFLIDHQDLRFNVSHSDGLAVMAATRAGEVGIDIEREQRPADMDAVAGIAFTDAERSALFGCPREARAAVFYRIWTRKEALLKAMGTGLPALNDAKAPSSTHAANAWLVTTLPHLDGYAAALARPRGAHGLRLWSWPNAADMRSGERRARSRLAVDERSTSPYPHEVRP